jgi:L-threonylcarbamoyladenylate synthase
LAEVLPESDALPRALELLRAGEVVAVPTETVYGLAADATNGAAVARIFEAKRRPRFNPLIAHVASLEMAQNHGVFDPLSLRLAEHFWPGPLTVVVPLRNENRIHPLVTAGLPTIALRRPRGFAGRLIEAFGSPLAAPSANSSGRISSTTAVHVEADLGSGIPLIVDGGAAVVGVESAIVKVENDRISLLRPGGIAAEELESVAGRKLSRPSGTGIVAPGMMLSHYAPRARMRLNVRQVWPGEALLGFGHRRAENAASAIAFANLSETGDLREAAANLFASLQELDRAGAATIAVEPVPPHGLGEAINDRLTRAAAPRDNAAGGA